MEKLKNQLRNEIFRQISLTLTLDVPVRPMDAKGLNRERMITDINLPAAHLQVILVKFFNLLYDVMLYEYMSLVICKLLEHVCHECT